MEKIRIRDGKNRFGDGKNSDPGWKKVGSGMEKIRIRDGKNLDPGWKKFDSGMEKIRDVYPVSATLTWSVCAAVHPGGAGGRGAGPAARRGGPGRHIPGQAPAKS
jgi:hypothetical protein